MPRTRSLAWSQLKLGILGVAAVVLAALMIVAVGGKGGFFWQRYPLRTKFADVQGMKTGAVVRVSGKEVGAVTRVEFSGTEIEIEMSISKTVRPLITTASEATIGSLSLLGEPIVDLKAASSGTPLLDGAYVKGVSTKGAMAELADTATRNLDEAGRMIQELRGGKGTFGKLLTDDALYTELRALATSSADVAKSLQQGKGTLGMLAKDDAAYKSLKTSLDTIEAITSQAKNGQGALGRLLNDEALARSMANSTANIEQVTARVKGGQGTIGKLLTEQQLYDQFNSVVGRLDRIAGGLEGGRGTAGKFLSDQQLYENMNKAVAELTSLIADIRKDPKKFLRVSVSIF